MVSDIGTLDDALAAASTGDEAGFLQLWRALQPPLLRFLRVLGCEDPEDVASETWLQVVRDLRRFSGSHEDFRRWLFTIARHRAIDAARARTRRPASPVAVSLDFLADSQQVEDQVLEGLSVQQAVALVGTLSRDQAEAVALRVIAGLETPDVAKILGKSPGAVRVALHRGLKALAGHPAVLAIADSSRGHPAAGPGLSVPSGGLPAAGKAPPAVPSRGLPAAGPALPTLEEVD